MILVATWAVAAVAGLGSAGPSLAAGPPAVVVARDGDLVLVDAAGALFGRLTEGPAIDSTPGRLPRRPPRRLHEGPRRRSRHLDRRDRRTRPAPSDPRVRL